VGERSLVLDGCGVEVLVGGCWINGCGEFWCGIGLGFVWVLVRWRFEGGMFGWFVGGELIWLWLFVWEGISGRGWFG